MARDEVLMIGAPTSSLGAERDRVAGVSTDNQFAEQFRNLYRYTE